MDPSLKGPHIPPSSLTRAITPLAASLHAGHEEELQNRQLAPAERRAHAAMNAILPIGVMLLFAATVSLFVLSFRTWATRVLTVAAVVLFILLVSTRLPVYRRFAQMRRRMALEHPDYALILRRRDEARPE